GGFRVSATTPVSVERRGRVAWLVLDSPERRNALGTDTVIDLTLALRAADALEDIGAIVLTGRGEVFSAGADLKEFQASLQDDATRHWQTGEPWFELFSLVPSLSKPVIAAVNYTTGLEFSRAVCGAFLASDDLRRGTSTFFALR